MKTLQNNYTTPEQSKRLLGLGLPADSADCYYVKKNKYTAILHDELFTKCRDNMIKVSKTAYRVKMQNDDVLPCWSAGRLIEIYLTCVLEYHPFDDFYTETPSLHLMFFDKDRLVEEVIEIMSEDKMDFSKLEE